MKKPWTFWVSAGVSLLVIIIAIRAVFDGQPLAFAWALVLAWIVMRVELNVR